MGPSQLEKSFCLCSGETLRSGTESSRIVSILVGTRGDWMGTQMENRGYPGTRGDGKKQAQGDRDLWDRGGVWACE